MLQLIVLGQIPGTTIQITFLQIASFILSVILLHLLNRELKQRLSATQEMTADQVTDQLA